MTLIFHLHEISLVHTVVSLVETANLVIIKQKNVLVIQKKKKCIFSFIQIMLIINFIHMI